MRRLAALTATAALAAAPGALAASRTTFTIRGAGFGHGIGLSQYGAYGYAVHGASYKQIVLHYYTNTHLENAGGRTLPVLLPSRPKAISFSGVTQAAGQKLHPPKRHRAGPHGGGAVPLQTAPG